MPLSGGKTLCPGQSPYRETRRLRETLSKVRVQVAPQNWGAGGTAGAGLKSSRNPIVCAGAAERAEGSRLRPEPPPQCENWGCGSPVRLVANNKKRQSRWLYFRRIPKYRLQIWLDSALRKFPAVALGRTMRGEVRGAPPSSPLPARRTCGPARL